jgi:hypothetical protein
MIISKQSAFIQPSKTSVTFLEPDVPAVNAGTSVIDEK